MTVTTYVLIAREGDKVKECIVTSDGSAALGIYHRLQQIYGGEFVAKCCVAVDRVPLSLWHGLPGTIED